MTAMFITNKTAQLYNSKGNERGTVEAGIVLECDWLWDSGVLKGMRKIVSGDHAGKFIKDVDLDPYSAPPADDVLVGIGGMRVEIEDLGMFENVDAVTFRKVSQ